MSDEGKDRRAARRAKGKSRHVLAFRGPGKVASLERFIERRFDRRRLNGLLDAMRKHRELLRAAEPCGYVVRQFSMQTGASAGAHVAYRDATLDAELAAKAEHMRTYRRAAARARRARTSLRRPFRTRCCE